MENVIHKTEVPADPVFSTEKTYVSIIFLKIKPEWYELSREERLEITKSHIKELTSLANKVARTHLSGMGVSRYDTVEILEAEELRDITEMVRLFRASGKGKYMSIEDVVTSVKGTADLLGA